MIRKIGTTLAVVLGVIALSATPAEARPGEPGDRSYIGPVHSGLFAGAHVTAWGCVTPNEDGVYRIPCRSLLERD